MTVGSLRSADCTFGVMRVPQSTTGKFITFVLQCSQCFSSASIPAIMLSVDSGPVEISTSAFMSPLVCTTAQSTSNAPALK